VTIERFEDLVAWQKAEALDGLVANAVTRGAFARDLGLRDQSLRASASIAANISEGFERGGRAEFHQFLSIAKGSCGELRSHLYLARGRGYLSPEEFELLMARAQEVARVIAGLRTAVARQRDRQRRRPPLSPESLSLSPPHE
jgi:four helix bundle protein